MQQGGVARLAAGHAVLLAAAGIAGCGGDDDGGGEGGAKPSELKFAYLTKQADVPYFVEQTAAAKQRAKELGVQLTVQDLQLDTGLALDAMDTVISQGVDGIVIVVPDQEIGPAVMAKAKAADVPIIASDDIIEDKEGNPAPYVGLDNGSVGAQAGNEIARRYAEAPWKDDVAATAVASVELKTLDVCNQRTEGAKKTFLQKHPDFPRDQIVSVPYDGTTNKAVDAMSTVLTARRSVKHWLIWSCNDAGVQGAVRALERANVPTGNAIGVGLDGSLACDEFKRGTSSFVASAYLDPKNEGRTSVQALYDFHVKGKEIPRRVDFPAKIVTPENAGKVVSACT
jgi:L-arabinose transport system substrate-binding protein